MIYIKKNLSTDEKILILVKKVSGACFKDQRVESFTVKKEEDEKYDIVTIDVKPFKSF